MSFILTMRTQGFGEECGVRVSRRKRSEGEGVTLEEEWGWGVWGEGVM